MQNSASPVIIGKPGWFDSYKLQAKLKELTFFKIELTQNQVNTLQNITYPF